MQKTPVPWNEPGWIDTAQDWIRTALVEAGMPLNGPVEPPRLRPWAVVMRAPTARGDVFFKAIIPTHLNEPALTLALAARSPDCMPEVIAADPARGWMLTRDAGTPLRALLNGADGGGSKDLGLLDRGLLDRILPMLAEAQMQWLDQADALLAYGVFDRRLERLPGQFERLAGDRAALLVGQPNGLDEAQYRQFLANVPKYAQMCARLAESPVRQSIHYDDMHTNNVFLRQDGEGAPRVTFSDWGDSSASHPFCSLIIFLRAMSDLLELPEESTETPEGLPPVLARLRDVYLEPWQRFDDAASLVETFNLAWRVGMVARALTWNDGIQQMEEAARPEYRYTVPAWLGEYLLSRPEIV